MSLHAFGILLLLVWSIALVRMHAADPVYIEDDGLIVIEAEQALLANPGLESKFELRNELAGHTGAGYLYWNGGNRYGGADSNDVLRYRLFIATPGRYTLHFHVSSRGAERDDLNNDCWLRMDEEKWYKTFQASTEGWKWGARFDHHADGKPEAHYQLSAGEHVLQLAGRSQGFHIDRIHLCLDKRKGEVRSTELKQTNGIPLPPPSLSNEKVKRAWLGGHLGAVWEWAEQMDEDDTSSGEIISVLQQHFDQQFNACRKQFDKDPLQAWQQLQLMHERWADAPREVTKQLKELTKSWKRDKRLKQEAKAQAVISKLEQLHQGQADAGVIAKGEAMLKEDYADTVVARRYFKQYN